MSNDYNCFDTIVITTANEAVQDAYLITTYTNTILMGTH